MEKAPPNLTWLPTQVWLGPLSYGAVALCAYLLLSWLGPYELAAAPGQILDAATHQTMDVALRLVLQTGIFGLMWLFLIRAVLQALVNFRLVTAWRQQRSPACPTCGGPMTKQRLRAGLLKRERVWACFRRPRCDGKIPLNAQSRAQPE